VIELIIKPRCHDASMDT